MSPFFETIRIWNGRVYNIRFHNERCKRTIRHYYKNAKPINLRNFIEIPSKYRAGLVKCRITYTDHVIQVTYSSYSIRKIHRVKIVHDDMLNYTFKSENRKQLSDHRDTWSAYDEVLFVKNGLITDTFYYNIVLKMADKMYTPASPLLNGVMRASLISKSKLIPKHLNIHHLEEADEVYLINALTPFGKIILKPTQFH